MGSMYRPPQDKFKKMNVDELLDSLYYDATTGYQGMEKLFHKAKQYNNSITRSMVQSFLNNQPSYQLTKQITKNKEYSTIKSNGIRNNFQIDIMYLPDPSTTGGYKYLLTCMDVYSSYVFIQALRTKTGEEVFDKLRFMFQQSGIPKNINFDLGSEFIDKRMINYCEENDIEIWFSSPDQDNKNAIIERFHRTLRNLILKYKMASSKPYIHVLPQLIKNYNNSYHKTIKDTPINIWNRKTKNNQPIKRIYYYFEVGDKVRHINDRNLFDKRSSTNTYTKKIFTITKIDGRSYYLDDLQKSYRGHELIKAVGEDLTNEFDNQLEQAKKQEKQNRVLNREEMKKENIIEEKRVRKPKKHFDD
jgi:transposase InsO family protein